MPTASRHASSTLENRDFVAKSGKWSAFEVSEDADYAMFVEDRAARSSGQCRSESAARSGDKWDVPHGLVVRAVGPSVSSHAASAAGVFMMASNSIGVKLAKAGLPPAPGEGRGRHCGRHCLVERGLDRHGYRFGQFLRCWIREIRRQQTLRRRFFAVCGQSQPDSRDTQRLYLLTERHQCCRLRASLREGTPRHCIHCRPLRKRHPAPDRKLRQGRERRPSRRRRTATPLDVLAELA